MSFSLGQRSKKNLEGVHPDLVKVVERAISITKQDFTVIEGLRTLERQKQLVKDGFSKTLNSRHLTGHAVDIVPFPIPRDWRKYTDNQWLEISKAMKKAADDLGVELDWGGDWRRFIDKPHYELDRRKYPA